jgi:predicted RNA-binding protein Jag
MLAAYEDIATHSEGQEPHRRLVVALKSTEA